MRNSKFQQLLSILFAGIGNIKDGNWTGTLIYFSVMCLLGAALIFAERIYLEPIYQLPESGLKFALLVFIAFIFFWDGNQFLGKEEEEEEYIQGEGSADKKIRK